jgi:hypothetical protein
MFPHPSALILLSCWAAAAPAAAGESFEIRVVDESTGRGVPLVELETVNNIVYVTDSAGLVAVDEPSLMNQRVFFHIRSHGYEYPKDGFGYRAKALDVRPGERAEIAIKRINIAERLYRVTGAGIYRDSVLLGHDAPLEKPLLNAGVLGSDSVVNAVFNGRIYWFWGDTNLPQHQLGIFHVPGATSALPGEGGLDPAHGVNLAYITNDAGQARATCRMEGDGPTWIDGLTVLNDADGRERLFAHFVKIRPPLETYRSGLCEFDLDEERFNEIAELDKDDPRHPTGHPFRVIEDDNEYVYFADPFPYLRVRATVEAYCDPEQYESYTCLKAGADGQNPEVVRDVSGKPEYAWRRDGVPMSSREARRLARNGSLKQDELAYQLYDRETGKALRAHRGSICWNDYRRRWVMIVQEAGGTSPLGELWYAEADTPVGPWHDAVKIVTHDNYSFYNPKQHPMFDQDGGRLIYFEGTYTHTFTNNPEQTPRYDYNQVMYRLDLADPRLGLVARSAQRDSESPSQPRDRN